MSPPRSGSLPGTAGKLAGLAAFIRAARQFFQREATVYQDPVTLAKQSASTIKLNRAYQAEREKRKAELKAALQDYEMRLREQAARVTQ